jgi:hypothetical protein
MGVLTHVSASRKLKTTARMAQLRRAGFFLFAKPARE